MFVYRISGLTVGSEIALPGAARLDGAEAGVDVAIGIGATPETLEAPSAATDFWRIEGERFLLHLPGIGRFLAVGGRELTMEPAPGTKTADALPFLLGTGMAAILHQRGALALHASTVERDGRAYSFCGASGIGKSTLAAALCRAGCRLVADDVSAVVLGDGGAPAIAPDGRLLKLFDRSIERLGLAAGKGAAVRTDVDKHYVEPPAGAASGSPTPLAAVYQLRRHRDAPELRIDRLSPLVAAQVLHRETFRRRLALAYAADGRAMALTAAVVGRVPVFTLAQREKLALVAETAETLIARWDAERRDAERQDAQRQDPQRQDAARRNEAGA